MYKRLGYIVMSCAYLNVQCSFIAQIGVNHPYGVFIN